MSLSPRAKVSLLLSLVTVFALIGTLVLVAISHGSATHAAGSTSTSSPKKIPIKLVQLGTQPPTDAQCLTAVGIHCYSPQQIRQAYNVAPLINKGYTGKGQTIVIIDSFGSPTIKSDLQTFDAGYGLPDPPSFQILSPLGTVAFDPNNSDMVGWAEETSLDVEWAHSIAPGASIDLLTSPVSETEGVQGLPQFLALEQYALDHHLGKIISQSWSATENTLFTPAGRILIAQFEAFYLRAALNHVTVFASAGDSGSANVGLDGTTYYPFPTVGFPASSPLVTAVGGTSLSADSNGNYQSETVWNDGFGAGGGGISQVFKEPVYEKVNLPNSVTQVLNSHRGIPDISYNAGVATGISVYLGFLGANNGFYIFGGTSAGSPQWAGIIADANQLANRPLGFLNSALYELGNSSQATNSFHDITVGNNGFVAGIPGYDATAGWDLATGWGTPKTATFVTKLIQLTNGYNDLGQLAADQ